MSLQFILGNSGSGKSRYAYEKIIGESMKYPEKTFLVIVPEQFTMQTQKELVSLHPKKGILNIDVQSFQRLAYHVFEEVGADRRTVLEETGKNLLLRKVAIEQQDRLRVLKGNLKKIGYITEMKSMISELTQYDITSEQLDEMIRYAENKPGLFYKLQDIQVLYEAFREKRKGKYITSEEILGLLCDVAEQSRMLQGSRILLDGFTGFTPVQQKLLQKLLKLADRVTMTITIDAGENFWKTGGMHELFYLSRKTIRIVSELAKAAGTGIEEPVVLGKQGCPRFQNAPALQFLERNFLRMGRAVYEKEQDSVTIHGAKNAVEEVHFAAREILRMVREDGYRYQDVAVITGDLPSYGEHVRKIFGEYGIPCFIDETKTILLNPLIEYIRAALEMTAGNFSYESVFRYLRTGLCGITKEETDLLENYVIASGKRGIRSWKKAWERPTRTMDGEQAARCEELRARIMEPLLPFLEIMKDRRTDARAKTEALYELLVSQKIQMQMTLYEKRFAGEGNQDAAKEYSQIYGIVIGLLDKVVDLLGDEPLTLREYTEILESGFEEAKVGIIPPTADRVTVGDIERTRLKDIKALIFLGLNDGWVPKSAGRPGILSELDRDLLEGCGVELAPGVRENGYIQRFYLYQNLTKPSEKLCLSYSKSKTDGGSMRPSYLVNSIAGMFRHIPMTDEDEVREPMERIVTPKSGISWLVQGMKELRKGWADDDWAELYGWYYKKEAYREKVKKLVEAAFLTRTEEGLGRGIAQALYGSVLENSVSRLEKFAACAFSHFLMYGLKLTPREEYSFQPVDMGNVFHRVVELFSERVRLGPYTWFDLPEEIREQWTEECVEEAVRENGQEVLHSTARNAYVIQRMKRIMHRTVWALCEQVRAGEFVPGSYEVSFSMAGDLDAVNIALTEKEKMRLRGRIDRIDICEKEKEVYVKVIDYKSGNTEFDMVALYYGLQLQLVVYLNAALEIERRIYPEKDIVPAGIFYYRMQDPMLDRGKEETPEEINRRILAKLKLNGLVNSEEEIVKSMDRRAGEQKSSDVIPVSYTKSGYSAYASVAERRRFEELSGFVNEKLRDIGKRILEGETAAHPYERKGRTACDYCIYREVCGFDPKIPGNEFRRLHEYKPEEIWKKIGEEV